ncbi:hypothetical protein [Candidatus Odyssella acanthamoebae]|uniref:Uncharacterized protein n=1 Tax=Candidatus Odyssella acanthamoebae TaxID=91604 RepID=A0A077AUI8_9PROT|nr:hypothetical protein [Candidatus Paracaedibacter acanthamoebae]AIK96056.1 hypothetical protein ID47_03795 [Candidatus Paracaedibacter acanthamoebae]
MKKFILLWSLLTFFSANAEEADWEPDLLGRMYAQELLTLEEASAYHNQIQDFLRAAGEQFDPNLGLFPDEVVDRFWEIIEALENKIPQKHGEDLELAQKPSV